MEGREGKVAKEQVLTMLALIGALRPLCEDADVEWETKATRGRERNAVTARLIVDSGEIIFFRYCHDMRIIARERMRMK